MNPHSITDVFGKFFTNLITRWPARTIYIVIFALAIQAHAQWLENKPAFAMRIKAAAEGDAVSQNALGLNYAQGIGVAKDGDAAMKWFRKAAEQNLAIGQYNLGRCYSDGEFVAVNWVEAARWFRKAAEQSLAVAQRDLGNCYFSGQGVKQDFVEAVKWYRKAAEQNYAAAQFYLGACYYSGQGVKKDFVAAGKWYRKAAEQNHAAAQTYLGACYQSGQGVKKNFVEAVKWYRKAAEQNHAVAQSCLGNCYHSGNGVAKDYREAARWQRKAAEQNNAIAQFSLGCSFFAGEGVTKDYVEAYKWYLLAAGQGEESSKKSVSYLEGRLTREQIAEGQKLARNFKPHKTSDRSAPLLADQIANSPPIASGTGFFITADGYLITNQHVIDGATIVRLVTTAGLISANVVRVDVSNDLALLKAEGKFVAVPVIASKAVKLGSSVATVGFPNTGLQGFSPKLAKGEVASLAGAKDDPRYFQISVPVQPGNSGGALVDEHGNVVGVVSAKLNALAALATSGSLPENVNYAVKSSFLLGFLESAPAVAKGLQEPNTKDEKFENVVNAAQQAAVLVLAY